MVIKQAKVLELRTCGNPNCGVHLVFLDESNESFAEVVFPVEDILSLVRALQDIAYDKAVEADR